MILMENNSNKQFLIIKCSKYNQIKLCKYQYKHKLNQLIKHRHKLIFLDKDLINS